MLKKRKDNKIKELKLRVKTLEALVTEQIEENDNLNSCNKVQYHNLGVYLDFADKYYESEGKVKELQLNNNLLVKENNELKGTLHSYELGRQKLSAEIDSSEAQVEKTDRGK